MLSPEPTRRFVAQTHALSCRPNRRSRVPQYPQVVSALHASAHETAWVECDGRVSSELHLHSSTAAVDLIPGILAAGVQVMMFAGAEDLICNYKGIERMLDHMHWGGVTGMGNSTREGWSLNGTKVGEWQEARNMTYVKVREVSHWVEKAGCVGVGVDGADG
jgi:carboxypeptidase D